MATAHNRAGVQEHESIYKGSANDHSDSTHSQWLIDRLMWNKEKATLENTDFENRVSLKKP